MKRNGFSMVELVVVLAIIGTLLAIAVPNYHGWQLKQSVEKEMKEMKADIDNTRLSAMQQKQEHGVVISTNSYTIKTFTSSTDNVGNIVSVKNVPYPIQTDGGVIRFDIRGLLTGATQTIWTTADSDATFDSIAISTARTDLAKR